jgi:hypothetical protein
VGPYSTTVEPLMDVVQVTMAELVLTVHFTLDTTMPGRNVLSFPNAISDELVADVDLTLK